MILVTGGSGFVGRHLAARLGSQARATYRGERPSIQGVEWVEANDLKTADLRALARGARACVHLAGLAHARASAARHEEENATLSGRLAEACAAEGVRRFVLLSSVRAFGRRTAPGEVWDEDSESAPEESYGSSKLAAERLVRAAASGKLEVVVLRPPLVYGPGVKANMRLLLDAVRWGVPLPLGGLTNRRSLVYVENLVDAIVFALNAPGAAGKTLIPADDEAPTPVELAREIGIAAGRRARILPAVPALLPSSLTESLVVRNAGMRSLGWKPPFALPEGLAKTVAPDGRPLTDLLLAVFLSVVLAPALAVIALLVKASSPGPVLHWSERIGRDNERFLMPKFRTMRVDAPQLPTHLFSDAGRFVTPIGSLLRRLSLDELPQLWSIIRGDLAFVGPRPALFNQDDLVTMRTARGIHRLTPGLTGWAQINGRDELSIPEKVEYDDYYRRHRSRLFDARIMLATAFKALRADGVRH